MAEMKIDQATARPIRPGPHEAKPPPARVRRPPAARVAIVQGAYLVAAGLWPILDLGGFRKVTGPKFEGWLPKGVGACMANIGAALGAAGLRGKVARELRILGVHGAELRRHGLLVCRAPPPHLAGVPPQRHHPARFRRSLGVRRVARVAGRTPPPGSRVRLIRERRGPQRSSTG